MNKIKPVLYLILFVLLLSSGCTKKVQETSDIVKIKFMYPAYTDKAYKKVVEKFHEKYPNIEVELLMSPELGYTDKLLTMMAGGEAPDLMWLGDLIIPFFVQKNNLIALDDLVKEDKTFDIKDIYDVMLDCCRVNGKLYVMPQELGGVVLAYNKDIFDKEKIPYPNENWTWDDLIKVGQKLTKKNERGQYIQFGLDLPIDFHSLMYWTWNCGGEIFSKDLKKCLIASPECVEGIKFVVDLLNKYKICPNPSEKTDINLFTVGKIAMTFINHGHVPQFKGKVKFNWDITVLPRGRTKRRFVNTGTSGVAMWNRTTHSKETWEFIKFLVSPDAQRIMTESELIVPVRKSMRTDPVFIGQKYPEHNIIFIDGVVPYGKPQYLVNNFSEIGSLIDRSMQKIILGEVDIKKELGELNKRVDMILNNQN